MNIDDIKEIDFDYWCNAKRDIIVALWERGKVESISELSRLINKGFSVTHRHLSDLHMRGLVMFESNEAGNKRSIQLRRPEAQILALIK